MEFRALVPAVRIYFPQISCPWCKQSNSPNMTAKVLVKSESSLRIHPIDFLFEGESPWEPSVTAHNKSELRITLEADEFGYSAPRKPVTVEVVNITLLDPIDGSDQDPRHDVLLVSPRVVTFSPEEWKSVQTFGLQVRSSARV